MRCFAVAAVFAVCLFSMPHASVAGDTGLLGHWTFDGPAGGGAKVHGAAAVAGVRDGALALDGKDDYVALGDLGPHDAVTVAFWMKREGAPSKDYQGLVTSDAWDEGMLHIPLRSGAVEAYLHMGQGRRGFVQSRPLAAGTWYHVAVTADRRLGVLRLLVNGAEEDEADVHGLACPIKLAAQVVGREFDGKGPARYFRGAIDDVRIYSRALDDDEIRALCPEKVSRALRDPRNIRTGHRIPDENYCDQPYVVITKDGNWLCTLTTGPGREGAKGQHVVATISRDHGRTWSKPVDIEPSAGPEASWIVPLVVPDGRVYGFYTYNGDNVSTLRGKPVRVDTVGWYAFKYSDDGGRTWSERHRLPMRLTACDRTNDWKGAVQIFWGIDKPNVVGGDAAFAFTKLGKYMLDLGEGWVYRSDNILTERDASKIRWKLLPEGDHGIRAPEFGSVQEEHNLVPLSDGSLYCVYRTGMGYPCQSYSRDGGRTWTKPEPMTYTPGGRRFKTPRACPMLWRTEGGKFLFWFHNNPGKGATAGPGRNPVWISGGVEKDGMLHWSQPEILLYDPNPRLGMSYPDLIEQDGCYWFTETQKTVARVHAADKSLLEGLWSQGQVKNVSRDGLLLELGAERLRSGKAALPGPLDLANSSGLSIEVWLRFDKLAASQVVLDSRTPEGKGFCLRTTDKGTLAIELSDGHEKAAWDTDPGLLTSGKLHHVVAIVDGGPKVISFVVDGVLCDGGDARPTGWTRYPPELGDVSGSGTLRLGPSLEGRLELVRIYDRYLCTSEAVAHFHAGVAGRSTDSR